MNITSSVFHRMANVVTLRELCRPFAFVWDVDKDGNDERALVSQYLSRCGAQSRDPVLLTTTYEAATPMIQGGGLPFGVYSPEKAIHACFAGGEQDLDQLEDFENEGGSLDEGICDRTVEFTPRSIASADTTLLDLINNPPPNFAHRGALILDGSEWRGVLTANELMALPARMCLLAMVLELERTATELCRLFAFKCIMSLSVDRRKKAVDTYKLKFSQNPEKLTPFAGHLDFFRDQKDDPTASMMASLLIESTYLCDKAKMIGKCNLSIEHSKKELESVFNRAERLRNLCAHPGVESHALPFAFADLLKLITDATEMSRAFNESVAIEFRVRKRTPLTHEQ